MTDTVDRRSATGEGGDDRWFLNDQREFLLRSLEDADRERDAGDLSDEDHAVLVARDRSRLAEVEAELAALGPDVETDESGGGAWAPPAAFPSSGAPPAALGRLAATQTGAPPAKTKMALWRKVGIVISCGLILLGGGILVTHFASPRQPGQSSSGSVTVSQAQQITQELDDALTANNEGQTGKAISIYDKVLATDPSNPAALASDGYLEWNLGRKNRVANLVKIGTAEIEKAVVVAPSYYQGHLFYGLVLENQDHDHAGAVAQFNQFLTDATADQVPAAEYAAVASEVAPAYRALGQAVPAPFATTSTTTTTTSAP